MFKHLQKLLLIAALCVPWVMQAQVTCDSGVPDTVTNLPAGSTASTTTSYLPAYSFYNYSYTEVIIPSSQLEDGGITEIKALMFKPENTTSSTYYTNCTIYLANTTVENLSSGFIQDMSEFEQVYAGSLNFTTTDWRVVEFDDSFTWDGSSNIVVAIKRDHGSYASGGSFKAFNAGASLARYVYQDSGPYTIGSISGGTATSTVAWYKLVGCSGAPVTCNRVRNLTASDILSDGVTLSWLDTSNSGATYTIYDMSDTSVVASNVSTDNYTITGLNSNTVYTFAVVADCGGGDVSAYSKITVRTACAGLNELPFVYGFEDAAAGTTAEFPSCWYRINDATGSVNYYPYVYASAAYTGSKGLYWYLSTTSSYADNEYVVLPPVDPDVYTIADLTLSFWAGATSESYHPVFVVGVMDDPSDTSTFVPVDTIDNIINVWTPYAVNFENYDGEGTYVAIKAFRPASAWYAYMDDIMLTESSAYCAPVSDLADSAGINDVTISWTGDESGTYLVILDGVDEVVVTGTTYTFEDLDANTTYEYSVAQLCEDTSYFRYGMTRTLVGEPINVFPYTCGFEVDEDEEIDEAAVWVLENGNQANYWMVGSSTNNGGSKSLYVTNDGTTNGYNTGTTSYVFAYATFQFTAGEYSYSYDWKANGESSFDFIRAAVVPFSTTITSGSYCGFNNTSNVPDGGIAIDGGYRLNQQSNWQTQSGTFTIVEDGVYNVVFMWRNDGSGGSMPPAAIDNIVISQNTCPTPVAFAVDTIEAFQATLDWTPVGDETEWLVRAVNASGADDWQLVTSHPYTYTGLNSATNYTFQLAAFCGLDDTSLVVSCSGTTLVTCPEPTNFIVTVNDEDGTADFTWTDNNGSSWEFVYGGMGFSPYNADNAVFPNDTSYQVTNLDTGFYDAYVRTLCGSDDQSAWVGPLTFSYGVTIMNMAVTGSDTIYSCAAVIYDDGGPAASYSANCQSTLVIYPSTPGSDVIVTGTSYTESTYDYLRIYSGVGTSGEVLFDDYGVSSTQSFGPFSADAITVVFHSDGSVFYDGFVINVACGAPSSCPKPTHLVVNPVQTDSVTLNWENPASASDFEIVVGNPGIIPDTVENPITTTDTFYVFNNLLGGVSYEVYIRANCGDEYSNWNGPVSFVPGQYIIGTSGASSISMCGGVIYDDGGANGQYSNNADYQLTVYPSSPDSMLTFHGSAYTESSIDYLKIYEGVGTNGNILWQTSSSSQSDVIPLTTVMTGPFTLHFHSDGSVVYSGFELYVNCVAAPECAAVENLTVNVGPVSAIATWNEGFFGTYSGATVEFKEDSASDWTVLPAVSGTYITLTGLTPNTDYNLRVATNCNGFDGDYVTVDFSTSDFGCLVVDPSSTFSDTIINGTTTSSYIPSYSTYNYSLTQQIFTANEIGHGGEISRVYFMPSNYTVPRVFEIYMGHVSEATATSYLNPSDLTLVYNSGSTVSLTAGQWNEFQLTTPFNYNGSDNLLIYVRDMTGSWSSGNSWYGTDGTSGVSRYIYQDSGPYNVGTTSGGTSSSFRSNIILAGAGCLEQNTCAAPVAAIVDVTTTTVDVAWAPGSTETSWNLYYRQTGETNFNLAAAALTATSYQFTNLNSGTNYEFKVEGLCDTQHLAIVLTTATLCAEISNLPYTEDFNNWGTGTLPNCWYNTGAYSITNYSIITSSQNMSGTTGGGSVYMYSSSGSYISRIIMPALDTTVYQANQTQVVFSVKYTSTSYGAPSFTVGVMDDPNDISTFTAVANTQHSGAINVWETMEVPLDSYTGSGSHIAIQTNYLGSYFYCYLDNVTLELIPTCPRPDSLMATNATSSSVDMSWHERGNASSWIIEYGPRGFALGTGTQVVANSNPFTLSGISAGYQGEFYVKSVCGAGDTGEFSRIPCVFGTAQIPATLPYTYNFETADEWNNWQTCSNVATDWYRGDAVANNSGYSMYISADQGATYMPYMYNAVVNAAAYRDIDFGPNQSSFTISFDARVGGTLSASYDGLMVFLVDPSIAPVATNTNITSPWGNVNDLYRIASVRLDTVWHTHTASFDTISGIKRVAFFWFNQSTSSYENLPEPAAIDNIHIEESPCPRPVALNVDTVSSVTATLSWYGPAQGNYEIIYRPYPLGTQNSFDYSTTNSHVLTGLQPMTQYIAWVRKICGTDTSLTCDGVLFTTNMCEDALVQSIGDTNMTTGTSVNVPLNNYYRYTLSEIIIDSAELEGIGEINAISFYYDYSTPSTAKTDVDIYLMPTTDSVFASSSDMHPIDSTAVLVYSGALNCEQGWNTFGFSTPYSWDGHSNLMVVVDDNSNDYDGNSYVFRTRNCDGNKSLDWYSDSYNPDPTSTSYSGSKNVRTFRPEMQLVSCGGAPCPTPSALHATNVTYNGAIVNWGGTVANYEVAVKAATDATWPAEVSVSNATSYAVNNLQPETQYQFRVRAICDATEGFVSNWAVGTFVTAELPCFDPTNLHTTDLGYTTVSLAWDADASQNQWTIHVWNTTFDSVYDVNVSQATVGGLGQTTQYYAAVKAVCGGGLAESDYSDTISFITNTCAQVTGVVVSNVTVSTATVTWNGTASSYEVEYGTHNFGQGQGTTVTTSATTYTITGLDEDTEYDVYVRAVCEPGVIGGWSTVQTFTTLEGEEELYTITVTANDATMGTVAGGGQYPMNATVTLSATPNSGYRFVNWNDGETSATRQITVTGDASYMANFEAIPSYVITVSSNNDQWGTVTGGGTFVEGTVTTITATANTGYQFVAWNDGNTEANRQITVVADADYVATFLPEGAEIEYYTVTVTSNNDQWGTVTGSRDSVISGSVVAISATANEGYRFVSWNDGVTTASRNITVVSDTAFQATFEALPVYHITVNANDPTMGTVEGEGDYVEGTVVTLKATANAGYEFVEWNDGVTMATRQITVTGDATYTATFRQKQGINTVDGEMNLSIYPNPASNATTIAVSGVNGEVSITVVDMNGRTVMRDSMSCEGDCTKRMEVSGLAQGAYFIRVNGENLNMVRKLIVK